MIAQTQWCLSMLRSWILRNRSELAWPVTILVSALLVDLAVLLNFPFILRYPLVFWFLLVCPGMAFMPLLELDDGLAEWVLAIALSLAIDLVLALVMVYTGWWQYAWGLLILIMLCLVGISLQVKKIPPPIDNDGSTSGVHHEEI